MNGANDIGRLRRRMGQDLKALRQAAGLTQQQLARRVGRTRSTISTLESAGGGAAGAAFWRQCDEVLDTKGRFARGWLEIQNRAEAEKARLAAVQREQRTQQTALAAAPAPIWRLLTAAQLESAQAAAAYGQLGWPLADDQGGPALPAGTAADAFEVPLMAGQLAIRWWLESRGSSDPVRGLPALPVPERALAAVGTDQAVYFLVRPGESPWNAPDLAETNPAAQPPGAIRWHAAGSVIPLPPGGTGAGRQAEWLHLPRQSLKLASPFALLDLLAAAVAATRRGPGALRLRAGVLAVPALPGPPGLPSGPAT